MIPSTQPINFTYQWRRCDSAGANCANINGATNQSYQPGPLTQTSYFMRCVRRAGCTTFLETNIIEIIVLPGGTQGCDDFIVDFAVNPMGPTSAQITWVTEPEAAAYLYTVEHSEDQSTWTPVASVMGHHNATAQNAYEVIDPTPATGMNFYRIARASALGGDSYSDVRQLNLQMSDLDAISIYPNPIIDQVTVKSIAKYNSEVIIDITTPQGTVIQTIVIQPGAQVNETIPMVDVAAGLYLVRVRFNAGETKTLKVTKF